MKEEIKEKIKRLFCRHDWEYCYAPYYLNGYWGKIEAKVCKKCGYKSTSGQFIPERKLEDK